MVEKSAGAEAPATAAVVLNAQAQPTAVADRKARFAAYNLGKDAVLCQRCGRPLKDYLSRERGIGPECLTRDGGEA